MHSILKDAVITRVMSAVAAGTSEQKSSVLDMQGFDAVCFVLLLGTVTDASVITRSVYENTASSTSSPTPVQNSGSLAGPLTASTDSSHVLVTDVLRPSKRYVFADVLRTTQNEAIDGILAIQYRSKAVPTTQPATLVASALAAPEV